MSSDSDPPLAEGRGTIQHPRFALVRRGFDPHQVDEFLIRAVSAIQALESELRKVRSTSGASGDAAAPPDAAPDRLTERVAGIIAVGEREAEAMIAEAKTEAATILSEAASDAERIPHAAQVEADRSVEEARSFLEQAEELSDQTLSDLAEQRQEMIDRLRQTRERVLGVAHDLELELKVVGSDRSVPGGSAGAGTH